MRRIERCGYCAPGQICSAVGLISEGHSKTDESICENMSGNICCCSRHHDISGNNTRRGENNKSFFLFNC